MTQNNFIYFLPSDTYYYNTLNIVDKAISSDAYIHVSLLECPEQTSLRRKIVNLFKKEYHKVYNKKLFYSKYNDLTSQNTELVYSSPSAIDFQYIVFLNPTDFYCPTFFDLIPDIISGCNADLKDIKSYQTINQNHEIVENRTQGIKVVSKRLLEFILSNKLTLDNFTSHEDYKDFTEKKYSTSNFLKFVQSNENKYSIIEPSFKLFFLEEQCQHRQSSYCFFYNKNHKCMNLENDIVGDYDIINDQNISIMWEDEGEPIIYSQNENTNTFQCKQKDTF